MRIKLNCNQYNYNMIQWEKLILVCGCCANHCENQFSDSRQICSPVTFQCAILLVSNRAGGIRVSTSSETLGSGDVIYISKTAYNLNENSMINFYWTTYVHIQIHLTCCVDYNAVLLWRLEVGVATPIRSYHTMQ